MAKRWIMQRPTAVLGVLLLIALCFGSEATTCNPIAATGYEIPKNGQAPSFCSVDSAAFGIITQLGFSTKTRRYYVTISDNLYTTATDLSSITSAGQLTLVNTFAAAPYRAGEWGNYPSSPAWSADLFLINTLATHPDPDVDHIGYSSPGSWADNYFYSLWVSSTGATNASEPLHLISDDSLTISDYPPTIRAMLATYDPVWNVSWWFTSNWGVTLVPTVPKRVLRPSIIWVNHATGVISNYTYPVTYYPQYGGFTAFVPNRQLLFYPVGSRLYYTPRSNHPFGPNGFQPASVSYVTIPGFNIFSILHLPESDSLLLGCSSSSILELDLSTMTIVRSNRYNTVPDSPNFSSQWISSLFRDPKHPRLVWAMSLWAQPFFLSIDLEDRDNAAIYGTNNQVLISSRNFNPGRQWVPSLNDEFFYQPGSAVLYTAVGNSWMDLVAAVDTIYYGTSATLRPAFFAFKTHDCSVHSTCQECQTDPDYCGWCSDSATCVDSASACSGSWNKTYVCPVSTFALPQNLPPAGGINITLYGSVMRSDLVCKFMQPPTTIIGTPVPAKLLSSTSVTCTVPSAETIMGASPSLPAQVQLVDGEANWGVAYTITYVSCALQTDCGACLRTSPCGWCLNTDSCAHESTCLQTPSNVWDRLCPAVATISPTAASALGGSTIAFTMTNLLQDATYSYQVKFGTYGPVDATFQPTARRAISNTLTAVSPAMPGASGQIPIEVLRNPGARVVASTATAFAAYNCSASTTCATCFSTGSTCNWCVASHSCVDTSVTTTCSSNPAACAALVSLAPNVTYTGETPALTLTGINLDSLTTTGLSCVFNGTSLLTTPATATSPSSATCPSPPGAAVGFYALTLGYNQVPVTEPLTYEVYDCNAFPCSTCIAPGKESKCQWCGDFSTSTVQCQTTGTTCPNVGSTTLLANCPAIASAAPHLISQGASAAISLTGAFGTIDTTAKCFFQLNASTTAESGISAASTTSVDCSAVSLNVTGNWHVSLQTSSDNAYTPEYDITVFSCTSQTSCASCTSFSGVCGWGSSGCNVAGGDLITTAGNCPAITTVIPNVALRSGGDSISIFGGPFTSGPYKCQFVTPIGTFTTTSTTSSSSAYVTCPTPTVSRSTTATVTLQTNTALPSMSAAYGTGSPLSFTFVDCPTFSSSLCSDTCVSFPDAAGTILQGCGFCTTTGLCTTPSRCNDMWVPECFNSIDVYPPFALLDGQDVLTISVDQEPLLPLGQTVLPTDFTCSFGSRTMPAMMTFPNNASTISCSPPSNVPVSTVDFSVNYRNKPFTAVTAFRFADCTRATDCSSCLEMPPCGWCLDTQACTTPSRCPLGNYTSTACPDLRALSPDRGSPNGGTQVTISGSLFIPSSDLVVRFGDSDIQPSFVSSTTLLVTSPAHPKAEAVTVELFFNGSKYSAATQTFTYENKKHSNTVAIAVGLSVGLSLLLLIVIVIAIILYRKKKGGLFFNIREPDYALVAFGSNTELMYRLPSDNYQLLETVLARHHFALQVAIASVSPPTEEDLVAKSMLYVAQSQGMSVGMINALVRGEIARCTEENTIFRSNSVASKSFKFYSRVVGIPYLWRCMARVIHELEVLGNRSDRDHEKHADTSTSLLRMTMEVDIDRYSDSATADVDTEVNSLQLKLTCQKLFSVLVKNGVSDIPAEFRQIFVEIDAQIMKKFNNDMAVYKAIGGFFFLRFVCPSITAPHYYGLLDRPPNETTQRQLVLISKVIQSLANMQMPGRKETYMESMSDFIEKNMGSVVKFYQDMREASRVNVGSPTHMEVPDNIKHNALASLSEFIISYEQKLRTDIDTNTDPSTKDALINDFDAIVRQYPHKAKKIGDATSSKAPRSGKKKRKTQQ